jgi:hypothetical protein
MLNTLNEFIVRPIVIGIDPGIDSFVYVTTIQKVGKPATMEELLSTLKKDIKLRIIHISRPSQNAPIVNSRRNRTRPYLT